MGAPHGLIINIPQLAKLLHNSIGAYNKKGRRRKDVKQMELATYRCMIRDYYTAVILDTINNGGSVDLGEAGHIQVLKTFSKRDWRFDKMYGGYDYDMAFVSPHQRPIVTFNPAFRGRALKKVLRGGHYNDQLTSPVKELHKILNLLNA